MSEHEARLGRDVYDYEHDEPRPSGRRRAVADWGVGEEIFDHLPRRRFTRGIDGRPRERRPADRPERETPGDHRDAPRGGADDGRRTITIDKPDDVPSEIAALTADRDLGDLDADIAAPAADRDLGDLDPDIAAPAVDRDLGDLDADIAAPAADRDLGGLDEDVTPPPPIQAAGAPVRRTVTISGRPEGARRAPRAGSGAQRLQPPRTVVERMGTRPERLAAWAFALGMLLIVIAVITAGS